MVWHTQSSLKQQITNIFGKGLVILLIFCKYIIICILLDVHWSYKNMLFWAGIFRRSLSAKQTVRCFKLKKLKKDMKYQVDFLLPLKLEEICYYGLWPQITIDESVCRIFYFWLVWLVKINTGGSIATLYLLVLLLAKG